VDVDAPPDGMPAEFIQGSFDAFALPLWGLKGAQLHKSTDEEGAVEEAAQAWRSEEAKEEALFSRGHSSAGTENSSLDGEWGWLQKTVGLHEPFFLIADLTQGALYQVEVEACAKYVGPVLAQAPRPSDTHTHGHEHPRSHRDSIYSANGADSKRTLDTASLTSVVGSEAEELLGLFGEEPGAEVRRGMCVSDAGTEEWERNIDALGRDALWQQQMDDDGISARLTQRALSTAAVTSDLLSSATTTAAAVTASGGTQPSKRGFSPPRLLLPAERDKHKSPRSSRTLLLQNLTARSWTQSELDVTEAATAAQAKWTETGWVGSHVQKSLDRYSAVLRDRRKAHLVEIHLPKYSSDRVVSKQLMVSALRQPRPVGRPSLYFTCSCNVQIPPDLEEAMLEAVAGKERFCSNSLAIWWFRPEEFAPVLISGYTITDNHGRSFWVSRQHSEQLATILERQQRVPQRPPKQHDCEHVAGDHEYWSGFVACAFMIPVQPRTWYTVSVRATSAHPLVPLGQISEAISLHSPGIEPPHIRITGARFDAQWGSSFTVSFVPPACFGTPPCTANPRGYTVHWQMMPHSGAQVPLNRRQSSQYIGILAAHRLEPAKMADARGRDECGKAAECVETSDYTQYSRESSAPCFSTSQFASQDSHHGEGSKIVTNGAPPSSCDCDIGYSWSSSGTVQLAHRIIANIRCPPEGREDDIELRLHDAQAYHVWVQVDALHVQPGVDNLKSNTVELHLPHPPAAVFLSHQVSLNGAGRRCEEVYAALCQASQEREELLQWINTFDRAAIEPHRLWQPSTNLLQEERTRKANIRRLLVLEAKLLDLTRQHQASRRDASICLHLHWAKPSQHGPALIHRYVIQINEAPWDHAEILLPRYVEILASSTACVNDAQGCVYEAALSQLILGKKTSVSMFAVAALQNPSCFQLVSPTGACVHTYTHECIHTN